MMGTFAKGERTMQIRSFWHVFAGAALALVSAGMVGTLAVPPAHAAPPVPGMPLAPPKDVHAEGAWVRAAPPGADMLAGYLTLRNDGKAPAVVRSADSSAFGRVELHKTTLAGGMNSMRPAGDQAIAPKGVLRLEPGGLHLMLMQPRRPLKEGDSVRFRLHFADGTALVIDAVVATQAP